VRASCQEGICAKFASFDVAGAAAVSAGVRGLSVGVSTAGVSVSADCPAGSPEHAASATHKISTRIIAVLLGMKTPPRVFPRRRFSLSTHQPVKALM
jgi:hypothetical protein